MRESLSTVDDALSVSLYTSKEYFPWIYWISASSMRHFFLFELLNMWGSGTEPTFNSEGLTPKADIIQVIRAKS